MARGVFVEAGVDALGAVVFDASGDGSTSGCDVLKAVLPGVFLSEGANEKKKKDDNQI